MSESFDLNRRLIEHSRELMEKSADYAKVARRAVDARNVYDVARAKMTLAVRTDPIMSKWTIPEKSAQVTVMVEQEMVTARVEEAHLDSLKMKLRAVEASLGAIQSQVKLLKTEMSMAGYST